MALDFPTSVKVGWRDYRIEDWHPTAANAAERYGECSTLEGVIRICRTYGDRQAAETLIHELLHAIFSQWTLRKDDCEEPIVTAASHGLVTVWRDNPAVFAWIGEQLC